MKAVIKVLRTLLNPSALLHRSTEIREGEATKDLERERIEAELARRQRELSVRMRVLEWEAAENGQTGRSTNDKTPT